MKKPELAPLEKPFKISYLNGKVTGFDADASDSEWSINIKKGLATTLQLDVSAGDNLAKGENAFVRTVEVSSFLANFTRNYLTVGGVIRTRSWAAATRRTRGAPPSAAA